MKNWITDISKNQIYSGFARHFHEIAKQQSERKISLFGAYFIQYPDVFPADAFGETEFFTEQIISVPSEHFLEIGIGSGVTAIMMAKQGAKVVGVDISERAVENAKKNAKLNGVEKNTDFYVSDVFSTIPKQKFDVIYWDVPFCYSEIKELDNLQKSIFDYQYKSLEKLFKESPAFLKKDGRLLVGFSNELGLPEKLMKFAYDSGFVNCKMIRQKPVEWKNLHYSLTLYEFKNINKP